MNSWTSDGRGSSRLAPPIDQGRDRDDLGSQGFKARNPSHPEEMAMFDKFAELTQRVHAHSPLVHSEAHGDHHWRLVAWTGYHLMKGLPTADPLVVLLSPFSTILSVRTSTTTQNTKVPSDDGSSHQGVAEVISSSGPSSACWR